MRLDGTRIAPVLARYRKETRVVVETRIEQDVERPFAARRDREARRPKRGHPGAARVLDDLDRGREVLAKGRLVEIAHLAVPVRVRADLVTSLDRSTHELRISLGDPAEEVEGGLRAELVADREDLVGPLFHDRRKRRPVIGVGDRRNLHEVEPVLDVEAERVDDATVVIGRRGRGCREVGGHRMIRSVDGPSREAAEGPHGSASRSASTPPLDSASATDPPPRPDGPPR